MLDEIKTLPVLANFFEKHITEFRRHRMSMTITAHGLQQFGKLLTQLLDSGCNFIIMPPCEKKKFRSIKRGNVTIYIRRGYEFKAVSWIVHNKLWQSILERYRQYV